MTPQEKAKAFKAPNGHYILKGLFYEYGETEWTRYTLKRQDYKGYPSLFRLYIESNDPTEYEFALAYLFDWKHWDTLCKWKWFLPLITEWREEMEIKLQAQALKNLRLMADDKTSKTYYQANKLLIDKGWKEKKETTTRTAKDKIKKEAQILTEEALDLEEDFKRIVN